MLEAHAKQACPTRQESRPFFLLFGIGVVLNFLCTLNRPPHDHHGLWAWLQLAALVLMFTGIGFQVHAYRQLRARQRTDA